MVDYSGRTTGVGLAEKTVYWTVDWKAVALVENLAGNLVEKMGESLADLLASLLVGEMADPSGAKLGG